MFFSGGFCKQNLFRGTGKNYSIQDRVALLKKVSVEIFKISLIRLRKILNCIIITQSLSERLGLDKSSMTEASG